MAQIAIIQPATPQAPPVNSPINNNQSQFSPHLENAISSKKQQLNSQNNQLIPNSLATIDKDDLNSPPISENNDLTAVEPDISEVVNELSIWPAIEPTVEPTVTAEKPNGIPIIPQTNTGSSVFVNGLITEQQIVDFSTRIGSAGSKPLQYSMNETVDFSKIRLETSSYSARLTVSTTSSPPGMSSESEALLVRLQQIINNSSETGTVSVTRTDSSPAIFASTGEAPAFNHNGLLLADGEGLKMSPERPNQQLNSIRLDTQQQYYEAKANLKNGGENNTNSQDTKQDSDTPSQPPATAQQNGLVVETEAASSFSQGSVVVPQAPVQTSPEPAKPIILTSGTVVHEEEIVQQLIERFQISGKLADTRVNIRLNPAELGELRIDISVKDGSIKAHVIAQSQQAHEIIEKNIAKLRTVLEDQGFTIDEISVTAESDSVGDFNFFDNQLFSQDDYTPTAEKDKRVPGTIFNPENILRDDADGISGVNVRV